MHGSSDYICPGCHETVIYLSTVFVPHQVTCPVRPESERWQAALKTLRRYCQERGRRLPVTSRG